MNEPVITAEPFALHFTSKYVRRLIIEAPYIYERLYNPSGSIILQQRSANDYSASIGNSFHNDLIDVSVILREKFTKDERRLIYDWAMGINSYQAADYYGVTGNVIRKRRQRVIQKLRERLDAKRDDT